jgi:hypothetical protein
VSDLLTPPNSPHISSGLSGSLAHTKSSSSHDPRKHEKTTDDDTDCRLDEGFTRTPISSSVSLPGVGQPSSPCSGMVHRHPDHISSLFEDEEVNEAANTFVSRYPTPPQSPRLSRLAVVDSSTCPYEGKAREEPEVAKTNDPHLELEVTKSDLPSLTNGSHEVAKTNGVVLDAVRDGGWAPISPDIPPALPPTKSSEAAGFVSDTEPLSGSFDGLPVELGQYGGVAIRSPVEPPSPSPADPSEPARLGSKTDALSKFSDGLPVELQLMTLRLLIPTKGIIDYKNHTLLYSSPVLALCQVCKVFHVLAGDTYYGRNTFCIARTSLGSPLNHKLRMPNPAVAPYIRRLQMTIRIPAKIDCMSDLFRFKMPGEEIWRASDLLNLVRPFVMYENSSNVYIPSAHPGYLQRLSLDEQSHHSSPHGVHGRSFAEPRGFCDSKDEKLYEQDGHSYQDQKDNYVTKRVPSDGRNQLTHWQMNFRDLDTLTVVLQVDGCLDDTARHALCELLENSETCLKAMKIRVVARIAGDCEDRVPYWKSHHAVYRCDGKCKAVVERVFRGVLKRVSHLTRDLRGRWMPAVSNSWGV